MKTKAQQPKPMKHFNPERAAFFTAQIEDVSQESKISVSLSGMEFTLLYSTAKIFLFLFLSLSLSLSLSLYLSLSLSHMDRNPAALYNVCLSHHGVPYPYCTPKHVHVPSSPHQITVVRTDTQETDTHYCYS